MPDPSGCIINGACGCADGVTTGVAPSATDLCFTGTATAVGGGGAGPWTWGCNGSNGGASPLCSAPVPVNGACGSANGVAGPPVPANLCVATNIPTAVTDTSGTGTGPWTWGCNSGNGGGNTAANACSALASGPISCPSQCAADGLISGKCSLIGTFTCSAPNPTPDPNGDTFCTPGSNICCCQAAPLLTCLQQCKADGATTGSCQTGGNCTKMGGGSASLPVSPACPIAASICCCI
jgi:hypothetical protein